MKILLLGKDGQVGWELQRTLPLFGELLAAGRKEANLENFDQLRTCIQNFQPSIIINAAAYTSVDKAESEVEKANCINANAVEVLANEAKKLNAWLIQYSTDYVFDGKKQSPYTENDLASPLSIYGKSKLAGEQLIQNIHKKHIIMRTSWVYSAHGKNFAKTILNLARVKNELNVIDDQYGAPTSAALIADVTAIMIARLPMATTDDTKYAGIYNLTASGKTSWHGFAKFLLDKARQRNIKPSVHSIKLHAVSTSEYPLTAVRPEYSCLSTTKLCNKFKIKLPDWHYHAERLVDELTTKEES